jgi:hypothetical protein
MRPNEIAVVSGNASSAQTAFKWKPVVPLPETLTDVLDHWRELADTRPEALQ